jgi:hypothetical protein
MSDRNQPTDAERLDADLSVRLQRYGANLDRAAADAQLARAARQAAGDTPPGDAGVVELAARRRRAWPVVATAAASVIIVAGAIGVLLANGDGEPAADRDLAAAQSAVPTAAGPTPASSAAAESSSPTTTIGVTTTTAPAPTTTVVVPFGPPPLAVEVTTTMTSATNRRPVCPDYTYRVDYSLRLCDQGPAVRVIQQRLVNAGSGIAVDGYFGPGTQSAVRQFQREHGLDVDGWVGPDTWSVLVPDAPGVDLNGNGVVDPNELTG